MSELRDYRDSLLKRLEFWQLVTRLVNAIRLSFLVVSSFGLTLMLTSMRFLSVFESSLLVGYGFVGFVLLVPVEHFCQGVVRDTERFRREVEGVLSEDTDGE